MDGRAFRLIVRLQSQISLHIYPSVSVQPTDNHINHSWIYQSVYTFLTVTSLDMPTLLFKQIRWSLSLRYHRQNIFQLLTRFTCSPFVSINDKFSRLCDQSKRSYVGFARLSQSATSFYKHL